MATCILVSAQVSLLVAGACAPEHAGSQRPGAQLPETRDQVIPDQESNPCTHVSAVSP